MEKFEYFPIKCRIQRALDMFQRERANAENEMAGDKDNCSPVRLKTKVHISHMTTKS
jgi:hypothetical protein